MFGLVMRGAAKYMRDLQGPETSVDVQATLALRNSLDPLEQGLLDSVLIGATRWQLRQQGRRDKQDTDEARRCECGALPTAWNIAGLSALSFRKSEMLILMRCLCCASCRLLLSVSPLYPGG